jgi:hypothetical protein
VTIRPLLAITIAGALLGAPSSTAAQEPALRDVLRRAASYVGGFSQRLSGMVAEETYIQDAEAGAGGRAPGVAHRELKSDFLLVQLEGPNQFVEFRDVFEVDGRPVRDRQDRLTRLFLNPSSAGPQAAAIVAESARYNIGRVTRTINTPLLPLLFLSAGNQSRFEFTRTTEEKPDTVKPAELGAGHFAVSAEAWVIEYHERARGTVIRTPQGKDLPASGRFWLDPATGRVLMSELRSEDTLVRATVDVSFQSELLDGLSVPAEMRERYELSPDGMIVTGKATYGRFRQFSVHTDESVAQPAPKP